MENLIVSADINPAILNNNDYFPFPVPQENENGNSSNTATTTVCTTCALPRV